MNHHTHALGRDQLPRRTVGRVTLIGDAARAMLPYMAQGAVQSIEDAAVLAKCLEQTDKRETCAALERYEQTRKTRTSRCQEGSRRNGTMAHLTDGEKQRKRDANLASTTTAALPHKAARLYGPRRRGQIRAGVKLASVLVGGPRGGHRIVASATCDGRLPVMEHRVRTFGEPPYPTYPNNHSGDFRRKLMLK